MISEVIGRLREIASPTLVLCLMSVVAAVLLVVPRRPDRLRGIPTATRQPRSTGIGSLIRGRGDAPPLVRRLTVSLVCSGALAALSAGRVPGPWWLPWAAAPVLGLVGAVGLGQLMPRATLERERQRLLDAPQALDLMASCLDAGMPVRKACLAVGDAFEGPLGEDLREVTTLVTLGASDARAWTRLHDHRQLGPAADDLARSVESGTMLVAGLRKHALDARQERQAGLQKRARAVGVRTVLPLMVCFIPSFLLLGVVPTVISAISTVFG